MDALLEAPDLSTTLGGRDHTLLLFLYNTGARADEAAHVCIGNHDLFGRLNALTQVTHHGQWGQVSSGLTNSKT